MILLGHQKRQLFAEPGTQGAVGEVVTHGQVAGERGRAVGKRRIEVGHAAELLAGLIE